jgi:hypothetical protein
MKLVCTTPPDGIECSQVPIYLSAKKFLGMSEASGTVSLLILQAALLVVWYEYGQAIYPAAYISAGWCVRYGNVLGINGHSAASELLGRPVYDIFAYTPDDIYPHIKYQSCNFVKHNHFPHPLIKVPEPQSTWTENEERRRTWWGVLVTDRIISIGSQGHILTTQEPKNDSLLPVNEEAWASISSLFKIVWF